jgi:hypothetical protein
VDFAPFTDIHIGMITSSLGSFGATTCEGSEEANDHGHLIGTRPRAESLGLTDGFLRWTPQSDPTAFATQVQQAVSAIGELGCGFEAPLEAAYHFLVDPAPYEGITVGPCAPSNSNDCATPSGVDDDLLAQRQAFLRPDSLLAVVVLTDEDDCSMIPKGQLYYPARSNITLPKASSACENDPNDPCCYSCGITPPSGCDAPDLTCGPLATSDDPLNLRCFDQKRRFGIDFLYPVGRYIAALTNQEILSGTDFVPNPLFSGPEGQVRDPSQVIFAGIVGVPWQDLQATEDVDGNPLPAGALRFKSAAEMGDVWPLILGNPSANVPPEDPLMVGSPSPRSGAGPLTGSLAPPSAGPGANVANGHEWLPQRNEDLQYACIFELPVSRDCTLLQPDDPRNCDCRTERDPQGTRNPLCQNPTTGVYGNDQFYAKAYPGKRHLQVLKGIGDHGVTTSICSRNTTDSGAPDYGYRPVVRSLLERLAALR